MPEGQWTEWNEENEKLLPRDGTAFLIAYRGATGFRSHWSICYWNKYHHNWLRGDEGMIVKTAPHYFMLIPAVPS